MGYTQAGCRRPIEEADLATNMTSQLVGLVSPTPPPPAACVARCVCRRSSASNRDHPEWQSHSRIPAHGTTSPSLSPSSSTRKGRGQLTPPLAVERGGRARGARGSNQHRRGAAGALRCAAGVCVAAQRGACPRGGRRRRRRRCAVGRRRGGVEHGGSRCVSRHPALGGTVAACAGPTPPCRHRNRHRRRRLTEVLCLGCPVIVMQVWAWGFEGVATKWRGVRRETRARGGRLRRC
jgi:hypothetical protein